MTGNPNGRRSRPRQIRITFPESEATGTANLLDEDCPETCSAIWDMLPLRLRVTHDIWSGHLVRAHLDGDPFLKPENVLTYIPVPGDIFYYHRPANYYRGKPYGRSESAEIGIVYERDTRPQGPRGPEAVNLFGEIHSGLEELVEACRKVLIHGQQDVVIERVDEE
jgi:hypothetical protein